MAFDFPSSPTEGQVFTPAGGPSYTWHSPKWVSSVTSTIAGTDYTLGTVTADSATFTLGEWLTYKVGPGPYDVDDHDRARFWSEVNDGYDATPMNYRMRNRLFSGNAVLFDDIRNSGTNGTWVSTNGVGPNWMPRDSHLVTMAEGGGLAISAMSRTSDKGWMSGAGVATTSTWALGGYVLNNLVGGFARAIYLESHRTTGAGTPLIEAVGRNQGTDVTSNPYALASSGIDGVWFVAGADDSYGGAATANNDTAIVIRTQGTSGKTWNKGIVFDADGITDKDALGERVCIDMAENHAIRWMISNTQIAARIRCDIDAGQKDISQIFTNDAVTWYGNNGKNILRMAHLANAVNYVEMRNGATGVPPSILSRGDDTNVDLYFNTQGTGLVRFGTYTATPGSITGYISVKDSGGVTRKLAVTT